MPPSWAAGSRRCTHARKERPTTAAGKRARRHRKHQERGRRHGQATSGDSLYLPVKRMYCPDRYDPNTTPNSGAVSNTPAGPPSWRAQLQVAADKCSGHVHHRDENGADRGDDDDPVAQDGNRSSGSLARFCQARNKAPSTTLALNSPRITGESQACWRPPRPAPAAETRSPRPSAALPDSRCDAGAAAHRSASVNQLSTMASRMSGNLNQNIQRQE